MSKEIIKKTKDYDKFQIFTYNRPVNAKLVKSIMDSIQKIGYMEAKPVLVDKDFNIIDGQHRFTACKNLDIPVPYVITDVDPKEAMVQLNARQAQWNSGNYIHMWADSGIKCYQHLINYDKNHGFGLPLSMVIVFKSDPALALIKKGHRFSINENAEKIGAFIKSCDMVPYHRTTHFVRAIVKLFTMTNEEQREKIKASLISLPQQAKMADYMVAFENIVNKGVHNKNRVSFSSK